MTHRTQKQIVPKRLRRQAIVKQFDGGLLLREDTPLTGPSLAEDCDLLN